MSMSRIFYLHNITVIICNKTSISHIRKAWCPIEGQWPYILCQWFYVFITLFFIVIQTNPVEQSPSREVGQSRNSPFVESEGSLLFAREVVSPPYLSKTRPMHAFPSCFIKVQWNFTAIYAGVFQLIFSPHISQPKLYMRFFSHPRSY